MTEQGFVDDFLADRDPRQWSTPKGAPADLAPGVFFLGAGDHALEVALATSRHRPKADDVRTLWRLRQGRRPSPLLLIVGYEGPEGLRLTVCGPVGENPPLVPDLEPSQVERLAGAALTEPSRHAAVRLLVSMLPEVGSDLPGLRNSGLLASQELCHGVPERADWGQACTRGKAVLSLRGRALVEQLGFTVEPLSVTSSVLKVRGAKRAVAVFLDEGEAFEDAGDRFGTSPVSQALALADREGLPWVILTRARQVRLYSARVDTGVGRKGRADTYVEVDLALLPEDHAGFVPLLFGADALVERGTIEQILERSADFAAELGARLRDRIYFDAVPQLATAVARAAHGKEPSEEELAAAYEETLVILFRLLFVAYAEDKDLLPCRTNSRYRDHSLKLLARRLTEWRCKETPPFDSQATDLWDDVRALWHAIEAGNAGWGVPPYDGGLFSDDPEVNPAGAAIATLSLSDAAFGPALTALLVDVGPDGVVGPVDFRSLSVREFGTIYEGLLESMLSVAPSDLAVDSKGNYVPTHDEGRAVVRAGAVYFHHRSGIRKATGSYFTKPFAVEHLLDHALEPVLAEHIARVVGLLEAGDEAAAAQAFFDFRCADIAMGSGHFLVAAVDRIEARLSALLALRPIPLVLAELESLRSAAHAALGDLADGVEIETTSLLRRQVARRCVYGVDLNNTAVELARLALWIHTFVPGLPLSFLDHNLVCGNSLTGIGAVDEAIDLLDPGSARSGAASLFRSQVDEFLARASGALRRLAAVTEATVADIEEARRAHSDALAAIQPARDLFDLLIAGRLGRAGRQITAEEDRIASDRDLPSAHELSHELQALHLPVSFPEVFERERPGFDCILGNPPWEKLQIEEHSFYALSYPGLRGLAQSEAEDAVLRIRDERPDLVAEYERETERVQAMKDALARGPYPGMNAGRPDLYKAFAWRFLQLVRAGGTIGVVLPRKAVEASGMKNWRLAVLESCGLDDITMLLNSGGWVFDDAEHRYTIGLISLRREPPGERLVRVRGPFSSVASYRAGLKRPAVQFSSEELLSWSESATLPLLRSAESLDVFAKLRAHPPLSTPRDQWAPRGMRELNASDDKEHFLFGISPDGLWPVYKGESFDIWQPETGTVYAYADPTHISEVLQARRANQIRIKRSALYGQSREWTDDRDTLPARHPRIAWRDSSRATDSRTVRAALIPPDTILVHQAYTLFWRQGGPQEEAYALGVMCSIPFDWFARQLVESHVTVELINSSPIPDRVRDDPVRRRVEEIAGRLAAVDRRYQSWAKAVGVPVGSVKAAEKDDLVAELDAAVALLYGLDESDLRHVFETFHVGWRYEGRLDAALGHFRRLAKETL